jgi:hypothetical protein
MTFFFIYEPSGVYTPDGEELPDADAARKHARAVARDLAYGRNPAPLERIVVKDEWGHLVCAQLLVTATLVG